LHPLRTKTLATQVAALSGLAAAQGPRPPSATPDPDSQTIFPRRIDRIATEAQGKFVLIVGACTVLALIWSAIVQIDKVTRGSGRIVTQQTKQEVQHLEGGIIAEILVKEGETVVAGQPLMRVENSFFKSELAQASIDLAAKRVRLARLEAETTGAKDVPFSRDMLGASREGIESELALFRRRRANLNEQLSILAQQQRQKEIELSEYRSRLPSVTREKQISEERFVSLQKLTAAGAASNNERLEAERVMQQTVARLSDLAHDIPKTEAALASGVINKLNVTTIGGVVKPGESLAEIVPADGSIGIEMRLSPADRADVWLGQRAIVKISAYEFSVYGGLSARVSEISPDAHRDDRGTPFFRVRLEADAHALGPDRPVLPGMLADVDVIGNQQSVLGTILKPLRRIRDNALRQ
jgi:membrane fusion protein, adhesin transport system